MSLPIFTLLNANTSQACVRRNSSDRSAAYRTRSTARTSSASQPSATASAAFLLFVPLAICALMLNVAVDAAPAGEAPLAGAASTANSARKWSNGVGLWGKRSAPSIELPTDHARFLVKRPEDQWNKLNSLWGKRSSSWQAANGLWGKRSSHRGSHAPDAERLQLYLNPLRSYVLTPH